MNLARKCRCSERGFGRKKKESETNWIIKRPKIRGRQRYYVKRVPISEQFNPEGQRLTTLTQHKEGFSPR